MIFKIVTLFLVAIAVLAMFGKLRVPRLRRAKAGRCRACQTPLIGSSPCPCGKG